METNNDPPFAPERRTEARSASTLRPASLSWIYPALTLDFALTGPVNRRWGLLPGRAGPPGGAAATVIVALAQASDLLAPPVTREALSCWKPCTEVGADEY